MDGGSTKNGGPKGEPKFVHKVKVTKRKTFFRTYQERTQTICTLAEFARTTKLGLSTEPRRHTNDKTHVDGNLVFRKQDAISTIKIIIKIGTIHRTLCTIWEKV